MKKKHSIIQFSVFLLFNLTGIYSTHAQCVNSGIGTNNPASKLHIVGCGSNSSTSSLHVMNLAGNSLLFVNDGGGIGVGTNSPVTMLHLNWGGYGAIYLGNNDVNGHIITHEPTDNSFNIWSGTYGVGSTMRMRIDAAGKVGIGIPPMSKLDVMESTAVGSVANNSQLLTTVRGVTGTSIYNVFMNNLWLRRKTAGPDWTTVVLHDGISVDASYLTPGTDTRTWWERDPWNNLQSWGSQAATYMTLDGNGKLGIGMSTPTYKLHVNGASTNGEMATFQNGTQETFILTKALNQSYNQITAAGDNGIFWRDNMSSVNPTSGFVIAPWNDATPSTSGGLRGIRIDGLTGNVGIGVSVAKSKLELAGSMAYKVVTKSVSYVAGEESVILASNAITITLPVAGNAPGRIYIIKRVGTGTITIAPSSGQYLEGVVNGTQTLTVANQRMTVVSDGGTGWYIIN